MKGKRSIYLQRAKEGKEDDQVKKAPVEINIQKEKEQKEPFQEPEKKIIKEIKLPDFHKQNEQLSSIDTKTPALNTNLLSNLHSTAIKEEMKGIKHTTAFDESIKRPLIVDKPEEMVIEDVPVEKYDDSKYIDLYNDIKIAMIMQSTKQSVIE